MDKLYDILVQAKCFRTKNESGSKKSDGFNKFHKAMGHNIDECEEFHQKMLQMMSYGLL
jgi:hypothetical protein